MDFSGPSKKEAMAYVKTPEDYKEFNQGAIEYFTELVKDLKMVNAKIK